jgi:Domain of unknown function (DUF4403)
MNALSTSRATARIASPRSARAIFAAIGLAAFCSAAAAAEKPPLAPDAVAPFTTDSRISATVEFGLHALAADIEKDIPRRLATIDERVNCVHRRVLFVRVNANCDIWGYVERSGSISLYGRGDRLFGAIPIHGAVEGQGANRFTQRIHGQTEASATVEIEARPELTRDWSLEPNLSESFHWNEPPILHVLGRDIPLAKYAEPRIRAQLPHIRARALAAARRLDLHGKAEEAWRQVSEPVELSDNPQVWLQFKPQSAAFAGVRADAAALWGSLELSGPAETVVGQQPPAATPTPLPPLGREVSAPGQFDVILPVRIGYDTLKDKIRAAVDALPEIGDKSVRDVDVYPSSGKLVIALHIGKASDTDPNAGRWVYVSGGLQVNADGHTIRLSELGAAADDEGLAQWIQPVVAQLAAKTTIDYGVPYQKLLDAANAKLTRPLKNGFRMEGRLQSAKLEKVSLPADGVTIALRVSGELKILYGL